MVKTNFEFNGADERHLITAKQDARFLYHFQHAVLLALKEAGDLTQMEYRQAADELKQKQLHGCRSRIHD